jgi:CCR4-NOT transcription complex subunit 4
MAKHKQQIAQKAKKNAQIRHKEAQKAEADSLSRKHLAGLRVVQKNLVYVTGLTPTIREDRLLDTLRGPDYFGQYGKIIKIVVSKARENAQHQQSVGVYVTFARKEDAEQCIKAVDGSANGERQLRWVLRQVASFFGVLISPQSPVRYDQILFGLSSWRTVQQPQLHVSTRTGRGQ